MTGRVALLAAWTLGGACAALALLGGDAAPASARQVCGFECCRPLYLHLHASAAAVADRGNESGHVDIGWSPITTTVADPHVPVHFLVTYCAEHRGCSEQRTYEGVIPADVTAARVGGVVPIGTWPAAERIGACGQLGLPEPMPSIVDVWWAEDLPGTPPCGPSNIGPPTRREGCFSDTDYQLRIARTLQPAYPQGSTLCFHAIRFWLHPKTDAYSHGADDDAVLVQHDFDDRVDAAAQCPAGDHYALVETPSWLVRRTDWELAVPNVTKRCIPSPVDRRGGQFLERCIFGVFARSGRPGS